MSNKISMWANLLYKLQCNFSKSIHMYENWVEVVVCLLFNVHIFASLTVYFSKLKTLTNG